MLQKKYRVSKKSISEVMKRGKRISSNLFDIRLWYEDLECNKYGVIVPKKAVKNATSRNRVKRIFRSAIFELEKESFFLPGSYVFYIKDYSLVERSSVEIKELIKKTISGSSSR